MKKIKSKTFLFFLTVKTLKNLKLSQIFYKFLFMFDVRFFKKKKFKIQIRNWKKKWSGKRYSTNYTIDAKNFNFLNKKARISKNWNDNSRDKLWLYNLHYQNDLNTDLAFNNKDFASNLIKFWIKNNKNEYGNGWEPYCISLRIVNWIKISSSISLMDKEIFHSLVSQTSSLFSKIEYHILGNHILSNAKALIFAGLFFEGKDANMWLKKGLSIFQKEAKLQFLNDGGHSELSPMYHNIVLWDICDLLEIYNCQKKNCLPSEFRHLLIVKIKKGIKWAYQMNHPDGDISFFNDSVFGIAPKLFEIIEFAKKYISLNFFNNIFNNKLKYHYFKNSGYFIFNYNIKSKAIIDVGDIGDKFQPGHSHADSLSFELSINGKRVFVNSGVSTYNKCKLRYMQRSTKYHNTVEIDNLNSSEVWSSFRVANRAKTKVNNLIINQDFIGINLCHNGYKRLFNKIIHHRYYKMKKNIFLINDKIDGQIKNAFAYFYLHPDMKFISKKNNFFIFRIDNTTKLKIKFDVGTSFLVKSKWYPEFGKSISNHCLRVKINNNHLNTQIEWS